MKNFLSQLKKRIEFSIGECWLAIFYIYLFLQFINAKKSKTKEFDIAFFPYSSPSSIGTYLRITLYEELFKKNNISFKTYFCISDKEEGLLDHYSILRHYFLYTKILCRRIKDIKKASKARICFVQRGMFPFYVNQSQPWLEKLIKKQGLFLVADYWDSVWVKNKKLTQKTAEIADLVSVTNHFLYEYFNKYSPKVEYFHIGIDISKYPQKENYETDEPIKLVYIGYPSNVEVFLKLFEPIAKQLSKKINFKLVLITNGHFDVDFCETEYHKFLYENYTKIISGCDIGLYLVNETELSQGKTAMKVMDYIATGIPVVASPWGVHDFKDKEHLIIAENNEEYISAIVKLAENIDLRKELGTKSRDYLVQNYSLQSTFNFYKHICAE